MRPWASSFSRVPISSSACKRLAKGLTVISGLAVTITRVAPAAPDGQGVGAHEPVPDLVAEGFRLRVQLRRGQAFQEDGNRRAFQPFPVPIEDIAEGGGREPHESRNETPQGGPPDQEAVEAVPDGQGAGEVERHNIASAVFFP